MFDIKPRLMAPGPVPISDSVLKVLSQPMEHHRTPQFTEILTTTLSQLKQVFQTQQPVFILTSTGSGAMEAAVVNTLSPGDEVIVINAGKFGERWAKMARRYSVQVHEMKVPWGETVQLKEVEKLYQQHPNIKALFVQACETSTGTQQPIKELCALTKKQKSLIAVDAITSIATTEMPFDEWGIDILVAGSQKAFTLPTGLSFICLSKPAWQAYENSQLPKFYFDLKNELKANQKGQTFFSSPVSHIKALNVVLTQWCRNDGLKKQMARSQQLSHATQQAALALGLQLYSQAPAPAVTALLVPQNLDGDQFRLHLEEKYKITVMGGQDQLKGKIIRVGHMGHITDEDLLATIYYLGQTLKDLSPMNISESDIKKAVDICQQILNKKA